MNRNDMQPKKTQHLCFYSQHDKHQKAQGRILLHAPTTFNIFTPLSPCKAITLHMKGEQL